jgi:hypothetical protein
MRIDQQRLIAIFGMVQLATARTITDNVNEGAVVAQGQGFALGQNSAISSAMYATAAAWVWQSLQNYQPNFNIHNSIQNLLGRSAGSEINQSALEDFPSALEGLVQKQNLDPVDCGNGYSCVGENVVQNRSSDVVLNVKDINGTVVASQTVNLVTAGNQLISDIKSFTFGNETYVAVGYGSNLADGVNGGSGFAAGLSIRKIDTSVIPPQILDMPISIQGQNLSEVFLNVMFGNDVVGNQDGVVITPGSDQGVDFLDVSWNTVNSGALTNVRLIFKDGKFIPENEISKTSSITPSQTPSASNTPLPNSSNTPTPSRLISFIQSVTASLTVAPEPSNPAVSSVPPSPSVSPTVSLSAFPQIINTLSGCTYFIQNDQNGSKGIFVRKGFGESLRVNSNTAGDQVLLAAAKVNNQFDAATFLGGDGRLLVTMIDTSGSSLNAPVQDFFIENCDESCRAQIVVDSSDSTKFSVNIFRNNNLSEIIGYVVDDNGNIVMQASPTSSVSMSASNTASQTSSNTPSPSSSLSQTPSPSPSAFLSEFQFSFGNETVVVKNINSTQVVGYSDQFIEKIVQFTKLDPEGNFVEGRLAAGSVAGNATNPCLVGSFLQSAAFQHPYIATSYNQNSNMCGITIGQNGTNSNATNPDGTKIEVINFDNLDVVRCKLSGAEFDNSDVNAFFGSIGEDYSRFTFQNIPNQENGATKFVFSHPNSDKSLAVVISQGGICTLSTQDSEQGDNSHGKSLGDEAIAGIAVGIGVPLLFAIACCSEKFRNAAQKLSGNRPSRIAT